MADFGSIAVMPWAMPFTTPYTIAVGTYADGAPGFAQGNQKSLSGVVTNNATPISACLVRLFWRPTGELIKSTRTASDGTFTFDGLGDAVASSYFAIAFDPVGGTQYNAVIYDYLNAG